VLARPARQQNKQNETKRNETKQNETKRASGFSCSFSFKNNDLSRQARDKRQEIYATKGRGGDAFVFRTASKKPRAPCASSVTHFDTTRQDKTRQDI
jgi:hypothetical protein